PAFPGRRLAGDARRTTTDGRRVAGAGLTAAARAPKPQARAGRSPASSAATSDVAQPKRPRVGVRSLTDEAYARLEELIVTLQLRPGVAVSESTLSERL